MDYMNAKEAADKWGLSVRRVQVLCEQGRVVMHILLEKKASRKSHMFLLITM